MGYGGRVTELVLHLEQDGGSRPKSGSWVLASCLILPAIEPFMTAAEASTAAHIAAVAWVSHQ